MNMHVLPLAVLHFMFTGVLLVLLDGGGGEQGCLYLAICVSNARAGVLVSGLKNPQQVRCWIVCRGALE